MNYKTKDRVLLASIAGTVLTAPVPLITCLTEGRAGASVLLPLTLAVTAIGAAVALNGESDRAARDASPAPEQPDLNALRAAVQAKKAA